MLFIHDHKFRRINNRIYSTGSLTEEALARYTNVFGDIKVIARVIDEEESNNKYSEITSKNVTILNGMKMSWGDFISEIKKSRYIILRMPSFYGLKAIYLAQRYKKPYLVEMVACPWDALWNHSIKGKLVAPFMTLMTKYVVKKAKFVIYVTNEFLQRRYPTKGNTVNCSNVVLNEFNSDVLDKRVLRIKSFGDGGKIVLGTTAGSVDVRYKGQQYIIRALGELKKLGCVNFEYQLVGGGDQSFLKGEAVKNNVQDMVKFLGVLPHKEIFNWLDTIDIYVQPSRQEGLPRALIEAMSRGLPAFGARTAGIPELLEPPYIFSNTRKNIKEICSILRCFMSKETMIQQANRNYFEAKKYDKHIIEERRRLFLESFKMRSSKLIVGRLV